MRAFSEPSLISTLNEHLCQIQKSTKQLDATIAAPLAEQEGWRDFAKLRDAGPVLMATLVCELPEPGKPAEKLSRPW